MRAIISALLMLLLASACAHVAPEGAVQARPHPPDLRTALLAMSTGAGGCIEIAEIADTTLQYFPTVRALRGACIAEHGDTIQSLVAVDEHGSVILLDSPSSFEFLLLQAVPVTIGPADAVRYAFDALRLSGRLPIGARFAGEPTDVPESILVQLGVDRDQISASHVVEERPGSFTVWVSGFTRRQVGSFKVSIDRRTGHIDVIAQ